MMPFVADESVAGAIQQPRVEPVALEAGAEQPRRQRTRADRAPRERTPRPERTRSEQPRIAEPPQAAEQPRVQARPEPVRQDRLQNNERPRRRYEEDDGPSVRGMGDHVPSFMLRPVKLPVAPKAPSED